MNLISEGGRVKTDRPVGRIPGTSLIKALDVYAIAYMHQLAETASVSAYEESDLEASRYAGGVRDVLAWLNGDEPSARLTTLLNIRG
jgi:hypothetical protein